MATVLPRDRLPTTKRPFGWISRLYKRAPPHEDIAITHASSSTSNNAPFLGIGPSSGNSTKVNDASSLRPTISTRAPSIAQSMASNAAIHNVEAISSPVVVSTNSPKLAATLDVPSNVSNNALAPPILQSTAATESIHDSDSEVDAGATIESADGDTTLETACAGRAKEKEHESVQPDHLYATSQSSRNSAMTSIFTTRTVETQPTISHLTHPTASIMSSRTGHGGLGANDNASMLTLASSSKGNRRRRNSTDTNCSVLALAPASARGSFESSRTGLTDTRRTGVANSGHLIFTEDGAPPGSRTSRLIADGMSSRRSVSGLSVLSDA